MVPLLHPCLHLRLLPRHPLPWSPKPKSVAKTVAHAVKVLTAAEAVVVAATTPPKAVAKARPVTAVVRATAKAATARKPVQSVLRATVRSAPTVTKVPPMAPLAVAARAVAVVIAKARVSASKRMCKRSRCRRQTPWPWMLCLQSSPAGKLVHPAKPANVVNAAHVAVAATVKRVAVNPARRPAPKVAMPCPQKP